MKTIIILIMSLLLVFANVATLNFHCVKHSTRGKYPFIYFLYLVQKEFPTFFWGGGGAGGQNLYFSPINHNAIETKSDLGSPGIFGHKVATLFLSRNSMDMGSMLRTFF
jgi:hypothetical protein